MVQEFVQRIIDTVKECLDDVHTAVPATIVSVDTATGLATVLPAMKKVMADGSKADYPQISGVPLVLPQGTGQTVSIMYPVKAGDSCLLIIAEQSLEYWLYGRETDTTLPFDLSNAVCIPGLFSAIPAGFADACERDAVIVEANGTKLIVEESGITATGTLTVDGDLVVTGNETVSGDRN